MRISDWSSDVCSSDLGGGAVVEEHDRAETRLRLHLARAGERDLQRLGNRAVAPVRRLPGVAARIDRETLRLAGGDRVRSEERRAGKAGVSPVSSRGSPDP